MRVCVTILLRVSVLVCVRAHGSPVRTVEYRVCQLGVRVGCGHACVVATTRSRTRDLHRPRKRESECTECSSVSFDFMKPKTCL